MTPEDVQSRLRVSRETIEKLEAYVSVLLDWNGRMNLIGRNSVDDIWSRHILDCGQLAQFVPQPCSRLIDIGSGAGLPGIVLAIMGISGIELVENDSRKALFLQAAASSCDIKVSIRSENFEDMAPTAVDALVARAFAPLKRLVPMLQPWFAAGTRLAILPKGRKLDQELSDASSENHLFFRRFPSATSADGCILLIDGLA